MVRGAVELGAEECRRVLSPLLFFIRRSVGRRILLGQAIARHRLEQPHDFLVPHGLVLGIRRVVRDVLTLEDVVHVHAAHVGGCVIAACQMILGQVGREALEAPILHADDRLDL